jgi:predicted negative regulator of RcsB-dependent stress response
MNAIRPGPRGRWFWFLPLLLLAGCAGLGPRSGAGPASGNAAVVAMLDTAQQEQTGGRLDRAAASLERALRIEPRNAVIWHRLARVRLEQGRYDLVPGLAAKSNTLTADDSLRAANWRLIGTARTAQGDDAGARAAFANANRLERR